VFPSHSVVKRENSRSIAAVVGSMNASATRYATRICCQTSKDNVEIIEGMKDAVKELLREFYNNNRGKKPERIVFYRDGVSEGQFAEVLQTEFRAIKQARATLTLYQSGPLEYTPHLRFACQLGTTFQ